MTFKVGDNVLVIKSNALRGKAPAISSNDDHFYVGVYKGVKNLRNPYFGIGKNPKMLLLAEVELESRVSFCERKFGPDWLSIVKPPQVILDTWQDTSTCYAALSNLKRWKP
jgi:hypothetical protein